ncbi:MAG: methylase [Oscillospiraceae bacterium]|nr:methylase [Oscillospiraceae bacterium]
MESKKAVAESYNFCYNAIKAVKSMQLTWDEIQANAVAFSKRWKDVTSEKQQDQGFIEALLRVFGVDDARAVGTFQEKTRIEGSTKWIDYLWKGQIAIEMKSAGENLDLAYEQLREYMYSLPEEDVPDLWLVCDFETIRLSRRSTNEVWSFKTKDLRKNIKRFANIAGHTTERFRAGQIELNVKAAEKMAKLHDALKFHGYDGHNLEVYLVRLLFCMFAGDTGIFPKGNFYFYIKDSKENGSDLSHRISDLFEVLNMPYEIRAKKTLLSDELKQFRYINGSLFEERLPPADFDAKMRNLLLECRGFDWSDISPAIFGAMFQGVMDKTQRRELGAHYTSEENILKLINPLFMDELWAEFDRVKTDPAALDRFHNKIANLKFLDPACGCGNFLIITYRELRLLELEVLRVKRNSGQMLMDITPLLKVNVNQFCGIELENFPCQIATVGLWLTDHQMNNLVADEFGIPFVRLPLKDSAVIVHGNALRMDWESVVPKRELSFILGNPPFVGNNNLNVSQREDLAPLFPKNKTMDYVTAWYVKSAEYMNDTTIRCAFVSTNSIAQGEQAALLWKPLFERGIRINFGIPAFIWNNEAKGKAAVHCVIVGFSYRETEPIISPYLIEGSKIVVQSRSNPLCDVLQIQKGNQPTDGGNLIIEADEYADFIRREPLAEKYIKRLIGAVEFINNRDRYCLWLVGVSPAELRKMPLVMERVDKCRQMRLESSDAGTRRHADTPTLFRETNNPETFIVIPSVSSERRRYIPIGFLDSSTIATNLVLIIPNASLYHFGILTSNVHMAWTRVVCGRLKSDYRYSKDLVYNNFPWPDTTDSQKTVIEKLAQAILDARKQFPDCSLADLYDPLTMPTELLNAHRTLDRAVMKLYGFDVKGTSEAECVAALMERHRGLVENERGCGK